VILLFWAVSWEGGANHASAPTFRSDCRAM